MKLIAESEGATLQDSVRLVVYVTDMFRFRPLVDKVQEELWGKGPYPPRTIIEVDRLNQDDIVEVEGTFYAPVRRATSGASPQVDADREALFREFLQWLDVNFQEVVHSVLTGNADVARQSDSRRTEWTPIRMPA
jgi:hypothetical protein